MSIIEVRNKEERELEVCRRVLPETSDEIAQREIEQREIEQREIEQREIEQREIEQREKQRAIDEWTARAENSIALDYLLYWDELTADEDPPEFVLDILHKFGLLTLLVYHTTTIHRNFSV